MSGNLSIQGQQTNVPTGTINIGPFSIPLSNVQQSQQITTNATTVITIPSASPAAAMLILSPSGLTSGVIALGTGGSGPGQTVSFSGPSFISLPAGVTAVTVTTVGIAPLSPTGLVEVMVC